MSYRTISILVLCHFPPALWLLKFTSIPPRRINHKPNLCQSPHLKHTKRSDSGAAAVRFSSMNKTSNNEKLDPKKKKKLSYNPLNLSDILRRISPIKLSRGTLPQKSRKMHVKHLLQFLSGIPNPQWVFIWMSKQQTNMRRDKSMLVYPAHHAKTTIFDSGLFPTRQRAGAICAATACECQNCWLFSQVCVGGSLLYSHAGPGECHCSPSLLSFLSQSVKCRAARLSGERLTQAEPRGILMPRVDKKLLYHVGGAIFTVFLKLSKVCLGSLISILQSFQRSTAGG